MTDGHAHDGAGPAGLAPTDWVGLQRWLDARPGAFGQIRSLQKFKGGQSNPTYLLTTESASLVVRSKPRGMLLPSAHAIEREYRVLQALAGTGVPVPAVHGLCEDPSVFGSAFYLMQHVDGRIYWEPELPTLSDARRRAVYDEMNRVLAALHEVDPAAVGLADYGRAAHYFERQIQRWTAQYRATETRHERSMERLIAWLPEHLPAPDGQVALVHGDFRLDNLVFDEHDRVVAILDWELSTLGHPYADLAYQCGQWRLPSSLRGLAGVDRAALGIPSESEYVARYRERRKLPPIEGWPFYLAVSLFRLAAICQGVYKRSLDGNASSTDAAEFGEKVSAIAAVAVSIIDEAGDPAH